MTDKFYKDRLNCLKSKQKSATAVKLTKFISKEEVAGLEGQIRELNFIYSKLKNEK